MILNLSFYLPDTTPDQVLPHVQKEVEEKIMQAFREREEHPYLILEMVNVPEEQEENT